MLVFDGQRSRKSFIAYLTFSNIVAIRPERVKNTIQWLPVVAVVAAVDTKLAADLETMMMAMVKMGTTMIIHIGTIVFRTFSSICVMSTLEGQR